MASICSHSLSACHFCKLQLQEKGKGKKSKGGSGGNGGPPTYDDDCFGNGGPCTYDDDHFGNGGPPIYYDDYFGDDDGTPTYDDDFLGDDSFSFFPQCVRVPFEESFVILSTDFLAIPPPTSTDPHEIGTTFIYEPNSLFNATEFLDFGDFVEIEDLQITGVCTRTSSTPSSDFGGGVCQFTVLFDGTSVNFGGFIEDFVERELDSTLTISGGTERELDSTLAISGGTGFAAGITGEVALHPYDEHGNDYTGDIFIGAFAYEIIVFGVLEFCFEDGLF
jgi:hypothetical protein